ncbi:hypothetical protein D3C87_2121230 [compost metagenome]
MIFTDNATNITIDSLQYDAHSETLISIAGDRSQNISITHTDASKAKKVKEFSKGAQEKSLVIHEGK